MIPEPYVLFLLGLIASRVWKLVGDDRILERPREAVLARMGDRRGTYWGDFIVCPWCAGFWISGIVYALWLVTLGDPSLSWESLLLGLGVWFAISALVGLFGVTVDKLT
jgi:hypothetical protein